MVTERNRWPNDQYSKSKCMEISSILESLSDNALEDNIQGVVRGIDGEVDT